MSQLVFRNVHLVDGTGEPGRAADVAIDGGLITAVEPAGTIGRSDQSVDADGLLLTPGFVDVHTHYDAQATWDPFVTPSGWHGVTTTIMGNCGVGFAPAAPDRHEWLIQLMEGVEDIPGSALTEGLKWGWETYPEYLDVLEKMPRVMDIGSLIGHGPLRAYVMGERGAANETATAEDIAGMARLVTQALRAGSFGFSTSRTPIHRAKDGELVPGTNADERELLGIAAAITEAGHGIFQFAPDHVLVPRDEWPWMRKVAALTGRTVSVNLNQPDQAPDLWRDVLRLLDEANADGLGIVAQVAKLARAIDFGGQQGDGGCRVADTAIDAGLFAPSDLGQNIDNQRLIKEGAHRVAQKAGLKARRCIGDAKATFQANRFIGQRGNNRGLIFFGLVFFGVSVAPPLVILPVGIIGSFIDRIGIAFRATFVKVEIALVVILHWEDRPCLIRTYAPGTPTSLSATGFLKLLHKSYG